MTHLKKISKKEFPFLLREADIGFSLHTEARNTKVRGGARSPGETNRAFIVPGLVFLLIPNGSFTNSFACKRETTPTTSDIYRRKKA